MKTEYDLVVLGAGNAGRAAARVARDAGWSVAVAGELGAGPRPDGSCAPERVLAAAAECLDAVDRCHDHQITAGPAVLHWSELVARRRRVVVQLSDAIAADLEARGIDLIRGPARLIRATRVAVGDRELTARKIVIAGGTTPGRLEMSGAEHLTCVEDLLERDSLPDEIAIVGAGVTGLELAHVLSRAGAIVTVIEGASRPLGGFDGEAVDALLEASRAAGIQVWTGATSHDLSVLGSLSCLTWWDASGGPRTLLYDRVVNGAPRVPNVDGLGLRDAGIERDGWRPVLDARLCSISNPDVYFAGDAIDGAPRLPALAAYEGEIAAHNLLGRPPRSPDYIGFPRAAFTVPALASVGLTEEQAARRARPFEVEVSDISRWASARGRAELSGYAKVLIDREADRIVGAHLVGQRAAEVIDAFALAIRYRIPATELASFVGAYPG